MEGFNQLDSLETGTRECPTPKPQQNPPNICEEGRYIFPHPQSTWPGPDIAHNPTSWRLLSKIGHITRLSFQKRPTHHVPDTYNDVENFLAHEALHTYSEDTPSSDAYGIGALVFGRLHHLNLHAFEEELAGELVQLHCTKTTSREQIIRIRKLLAEYCKQSIPLQPQLLLCSLIRNCPFGRLGQAVRNFEHLSTSPFRPPDQRALYPFHETILPSLYNLIREDPLAEYDNIYHGIQTSYATWSQGFVNKIWGAIFGGLSLIIPMVVMTVHSNVQKSLVVSSLSVFLVAMIVGRFSEGSWKDVLGVTAAYAAVLVVFVGTTTGTSL